MGCINAKLGGNVVAASPVSALHYNSSHGLAVASFPRKQQSGRLEVDRDEEKLDGNGKTMNHHIVKRSGESRKSKRWSSSRRSGSFSFNFGFSHRFVEAEQVAAGWPAWLCSAAAEAVHGWVPLQADAFEKLDKIGQGTYSSVFQAREVETGRMVALKKVRFDNSQPESIRFMAREIAILRRLDHPNIMKLEGVITSRFSSTVYLVFEYMEHDLAGLSSSPDINFSEPQVKCYMKQLLLGVEHCHSRGIMHRDIKASNILVNNEGTLKLGDFGLANILTSKNRHRLTSRVVTLWYRPPELLMGSTSYEASVDLWSVGCVFAELLIGKPILKGRTEVEQLHKIFKLCGSPPDEYWTKIRLPHSTMFKPQHAYQSCLRERCKDIPPTALNLLEALLSVEPHKRGTASSSLMSEYFHTKPHACDPSSLPKYLPNKEIDAKQRDELRRKKSRSRIRDSGASRRTRRYCNTSLEPISFGKTAQKEEVRGDTQFSTKSYGFTANSPRGNDGTVHREQLNLPFDTRSEASQVTSVSQCDIFTAPPPLTGSSSFSWAKKPKDSTSTLSYNRPSSLQPTDAGSSSFSVSNAKIFKLKKQETQDVPGSVYTASGQQEQPQNRSNRHNKFNKSDVFDASVFQPRDYTVEFHQEEVIAINNDMVTVGYSGPLVTESSKFDELLQRNENHIQQVTRRSRFNKGMAKPSLWLNQQEK
ncbi:CDC2C [Hibiscus trionum]|uniref:CDC2C n=1 Tax=Hibiscus trionum TaxID=183268 RepID=A0A9W7LQE3_HIBTR|nr:CDC2C [Hibiscus trionum]